MTTDRNKARTLEFRPDRPSAASGVTGSHAWQAVDASGEADAMISYLDRAATATSDLRAECVAQLRLAPGATVLDAGCGSGVAALQLADVVGPSGVVHAIDQSEAMVACTAKRAQGRPVWARVGDVRSIELPDHCCDGARMERVLIHLAPDEAQAAVDELARVVRPQGRISLVETCHAQCRIDGDDVLLPSIAKVVANPTMGIHLRAALLAAGCEDVVAVPWPLVLTTIADLRPVVRLEVAARAAVSAGVNEDEIKAAMAGLGRRDHDGVFLAVMMFYVASGTVGR